MFDRLLLADEDFILTVGLLGGITVGDKRRRVKLVASASERRCLNRIVRAMRSARVGPDSKAFTSLLRDFAHAVVSRGTQPWESFFKGQTIEGHARHYVAIDQIYQADAFMKGNF